MSLLAQLLGIEAETQEAYEHDPKESTRTDAQIAGWAVDAYYRDNPTDAPHNAIAHMNSTTQQIDAMNSWDSDGNWIG